MRDCEKGAAAIEFALVAPMLIVMMLGVLMVGQHMHDYNALRSIANDVHRYTVVEYQKGNQLNELQVEQVAAAIAARAPYRFHPDQLDTGFVELEDQPVTGATMFELELSYTPPAFSLPIDISPPTIVFSERVVVPD